MNWFWITYKDRHVEIGLKKEALKELGLVWQYLPRVKKGDVVFKGGALATIQTTTQLRSLVSPVAGTIVGSFGKAVERPELITPDVALFSLDVSRDQDALSRV